MRSGWRTITLSSELERRMRARQRWERRRTTRPDLGVSIVDLRFPCRRASAAGFPLAACGE